MKSSTPELFTAIAVFASLGTPAWFPPVRLPPLANRIEHAANHSDSGLALACDP